MFTKKRCLWITLLLSLAIVLVYFGLVILSRPPRVTLPDPNGYDDLLSAAQLVSTPRWLGDLDQADSDELRSYVERHAESLTLISRGLDQESRVRPPNSSTDWHADVESVGQMRALARLLLAQGKLAERDQDMQSALESYLRIMKLGQHAARGGPLLHATMGSAIESMAFRGAAEIRAKLSAEQREQLARSAQQFAETKLPLDEVLAMEDLWSRSSPTPSINRAMLRMTGKYDQLMQPAIDGFTQTRARVQTQYSLLRIDHALWRYVTDHGNPPKNLDALVPDYMASVPRDMLGDRQFVYDVTSEGYSVSSRLGPAFQERNIALESRLP